jgi:glutamyl-tRNA synthetase
MLHFGTARTALVAWLRARAAGGRFVVRLEDLDAPRVRPGAAQAILDDLRWLGLDWDEGPDVGGPFGPYVQSQRLDRYERAFERLLAGGYLYPCTCSRREIAEIASAPHGEEPVYPGTCRRGLSHPGRTPAWRFRLEEPPTFVDGLAGPSRPGLGAGDFVVRRADGVFAYQLAVVVDDREMEITEVVRGDDLLASTPRQIALHRALDERASEGCKRREPAFFHVPLVLGEDGERLSKRHGAVALADARAAGVAPEAIIAKLAATLGLLDPRESTISARALVDRFDPDLLVRTPVRMELPFWR